MGIIVSCYEGIWGALKKVWEWGQKAAKYLGLGGGDKAGAVQSTDIKAAAISKRAAGGLVSQPEIALIAEEGPEMVVPLTNKSLGLQRLAQAAAMLIPGNRGTGRSLGGGLNKFGGGPGQVTITYAPQIYIQGNADRQDFLALLKAHKNELKRMYEEIVRDKIRAEFA